MAQATTEQYETAIENFRRQASEYRKRAESQPVGSWQRTADQRLAYKADMQADDLDRLLTLRAEREYRMAVMG